MRTIKGKNRHKKDKEKEEQENNSTTTAAVYRLYESEVGTITQVIADRIGEAIDTYPGDWFKPAFEEAARNNKRNWAYVEAILKRWKSDGFQSRNGKRTQRKDDDYDPAAHASEVYN